MDTRTGAGFDHLGASHNARGIAAMTAASAFFVVGDTLVKLAGRDLPVSEIVFVRSVLAGAILVAVAHHSGALRALGPALANRHVLLRSVFEAGSTISFFVGLVQMSYADAAAILQVAPIVVTAGAAIFLGDPVGWRRWLATFIGFLGVLLILKPGASTFDWHALYIVVCVLCIAGRDLVTRRIGTVVPTIVVTLSAVMAIGASALLLAPFERAWVMPSPVLMAAIVTTAVTSTLGFFSLIIATRSGEVAVVSPFRYTMIPFAVFSSVAVFGDWPDALTVLGLVIVTAAGLYSLHREQVRRRMARLQAA
jgi:drug/metabolite transporter (DMT)-like permease